MQVQQNLFVSNRTQTVRSVLGHAITFQKGKPTHVPKALHQTVIEKGILPCDETGKALPEKGEDIVEEATQESKPVLAPATAEEREEKILEVFKAMIAANDPKEFTGGGTPNAEAVTTRLAWKTDQKEVRQLWLKHRPTLLGNE